MTPAQTLCFTEVQRNLALLRKIALNIVGSDKATKASVRARRKKAAWNNAYMLKLLVG